MNRRFLLWCVGILLAGSLAGTASAQPYSTVSAWAENLPDAVDLVVVPPSATQDSQHWAGISQAMETGPRLLAFRAYSNEDATEALLACAEFGARILVVPAALVGQLQAPDSLHVIAVRGESDRAAADLFAQGADAVWESQSWLDEPEELDIWYRDRAGFEAPPNGSQDVREPVGEIGISWLLSPGSIALPERTGWSELERAALRFRKDHASVAFGQHETLSKTPFASYRGLRMDRGKLDETIVVFGAQGRTRIKVSRVLADNVVLRDVLTGSVSIVSFGEVSFVPGPTGVLMLEVLD